MWGLYHKSHWGFQTVASVPALAGLLTKAVLYVAPRAAFPTCTGDNNKINNKKEGRAASKINRAILNIQGHEIFIQHHLFGVHAERLAPGIEFIEVKSECVCLCVPAED